MKKIYSPFYLISLFYLVLSFQSCAIFKNDLPNNFPLKNSNLSALEGFYKIEASKIDTIKHGDWFDNNHGTRLDANLMDDKLLAFSDPQPQFEIKIIDKRQVRFTFWDGPNVIKEFFFKSRLGHNCYLYLKNKNVELIGVPYLFGALSVNRIRMTLDKDKNLILDMNNFRGGAILLIGFIDWGSNEYRKTYKRVERKTDEFQK